MNEFHNDYNGTNRQPARHLPSHYNKPDVSIPNYIMDQMRILKVNKNDRSDIKLIGSASYRAPLYPSDIDMYEKTSLGFNKPSAIQFFKMGIMGIVRDILNSKNHFFIELKCGIDERYDFDIGTFNNGRYNPSNGLLNKLEVMRDMRLISEKEFNIFAEHLDKQTHNQYDYETINELLRPHRIIRWTATEVLQGFKTLSGGVHYTLEDGINTVSPINIEVLAIIEGKARDVSNFYVIGFTKNNHLHVINFPQDIIDNFGPFLIENLKQSIEKLGKSIYNYAPFKLAKRYFSLARFTDNEPLINTVVPLLNSQLGFVSQLKSEIATVLKAMKIRNFPIDVIKNQIDDIRFKFASVTQISKGDIIEITKLLNNDPAAGLDEIAHVLGCIINREAKTYLELYGLLPVPDEYLPMKKHF